MSSKMRGVLRFTLVAGSAMLWGCSGSARTVPTLPAAQSGAAIPAGARRDAGPSFVLVPGYRAPFIASDQQGGEWFYAGGAVTRVDEQTYAGQTYPVTHALDRFALGRNKMSMWFVSSLDDVVGRISLSTRKIYWYNLTPGSYSVNIAAGSDDAMWFTEAKRARIGRINAKNFTITEYPIPSGDQPYDIALGPDDAMWFTTTDGYVGRISIKTHAITEYSAGGDAFTITQGPDGAMWFSDDAYGKIGRIDTKTHAITHYSPAGKQIIPAYIVSRDNYLWFADINGRVDKLNPTTHHFTLYAVPTHGAAVYSIAVGSDDQLWFTEKNENEIVKMCPELGATECATTP
jgi:virginiamycin B lyase